MQTLQTCNFDALSCIISVIASATFFSSNTVTYFSALTHLTTFELLLPTRKSASFPIVTQKTETPLGIAATIEVCVCASCLL